MRFPLILLADLSGVGMRLRVERQVFTAELLRPPFHPGLMAAPTQRPPEDLLPPFSSRTLPPTCSVDLILLRFSKTCTSSKPPPTYVCAHRCIALFLCPNLPAPLLLFGVSPFPSLSVAVLPSPSRIGSTARNRYHVFSST